MDHSTGLVFRRPQATLTADLWSIFARHPERRHASHLTSACLRRVNEFDHFPVVDKPDHCWHGAALACVINRVRGDAAHGHHKVRLVPYDPPGFPLQRGPIFLGVDPEIGDWSIGHQPVQFLCKRLDYHGSRVVVLHDSNRKGVSRLAGGGDVPQAVENMM